MRYEFDPIYALIVLPIAAVFIYFLKDRMPRQVFWFLGVAILWSPIYIGLLLNDMAVRAMIVFGMSILLWWHIKDES